jgi:hypothetical protein
MLQSPQKLSLRSDRSNVQMNFVYPGRSAKPNFWPRKRAVDEAFRTSGPIATKTPNNKYISM